LDCRNVPQPSPSYYPASVRGQASNFTWLADEEGDTTTVSLAGEITLQSVPELWAKVNSLLDESNASRVILDVSQLSHIDSAGVSTLVHFERELRRTQVACSIRGATPDFQKLFALHRRKRRLARPDRRAKDLLSHIGEATVGIGLATRDAVAFLGELVATVVRGGFAFRRYNLRDAALTAERAGMDAVPIVLLINFLIGFVMAYQSARQLERFGANILVADLVGIAVVRELGPLMTAIIVCGRTGAAFAAELGTMKVAEEVDALRTFGLSPMQHLVVPRILGLVAVAPVLTILADAVGIGGGLLVGTMKLGISAQSFISELQQALKLRDLLSGLVKSMVFAGACAIIACERGLSVTGGASEVGQRTTSAVVSILFSLIVLDAIFTVILEALFL
jgi:phospholipid/cholesterol/gamma-HCH transport system permease protein